jgi:hypothetical protein
MLGLIAFVDEDLWYGECRDPIHPAVFLKLQLAVELAIPV